MTWKQFLMPYNVGKAIVAGLAFVIAHPDLAADSLTQGIIAVAMAVVTSLVGRDALNRPSPKQDSATGVPPLS